MAVKTCPKCREDNSEAAVICITGTTLWEGQCSGRPGKQSGVEKERPAVCKNEQLGIVLVVCFDICAVLLIINFTKYQNPGSIKIPVHNLRTAVCRSIL